jgi:hypothetical protein
MFDSLSRTSAKGFNPSLAAVSGFKISSCSKDHSRAVVRELADRQHPGCTGTSALSKLVRIYISQSRF